MNNSEILTKLNAIPEPLPEGAIALPGDDMQLHESAMIIFEKAVTKGRLYRHNDGVVAVRDGKLAPVNPDSFRSELELIGRPHRKVLKGDNLRWKPTTCSRDTATALLNCHPGTSKLKEIRRVTTTRDLVSVDGKLRLLDAGYNDFNGGTFVTGDAGEPPAVPLDQAKQKLTELFGFYELSPADLSRSIAALLTPALKRGRFISGDTPIHTATASGPGAGKTTLLKICAQPYQLLDEEVATISQQKRGVGGLCESIAAAVCGGASEVLLDNVRDLSDTEMIEALVTSKSMLLRVPYKVAKDADVSGLSLYLSANNLENTPDLASRLSLISVPSRQEYEHTGPNSFDEVRENPSYYLGCIQAIIREWDAAGRPKVPCPQSRFRDWADTTSGILQHVFSLPPVTQGLHAAQAKTSSPALVMLESVARQVLEAPGVITLTGAEIVKRARACEIDLGRFSKHEDPAIAARAMGSELKKAFTRAKDGHLRLGDIIIHRAETHDGSFYNITRVPAPPQN